PLVCRGWGSVSFFCQAEDGIRAFHVTGVQTCALPIYAEVADIRIGGVLAAERNTDATQHGDGTTLQHREHLSRKPAGTSGHNGRSEERRVGKECRARRPADE